MTSFQTSKSRVSQKWNNGERGAALVEAAIVFMPLCLILFGMVEYGFIFKDSLTISSATRAGARTASAEPKAVKFQEDTVAAVTSAANALNMKSGDELFIYKANPSTGLPDSGNINSCTSNCNAYKWNGTKFVSSGGSGWDYNSQVACLGNADSVGVRLMIQHDALSGFFKNMKLKEKTVMRLEPLSVDCA